MKVAAVRARYEHLAGRWRRSSPERRRGLIGELELLALQLPVVHPDDPGRDEIVALRAHIRELVTEISIGSGRTGLTWLQADHRPRSAAPGWGRWVVIGITRSRSRAGVLDQDRPDVTTGVVVEKAVCLPRHAGHHVRVQIAEPVPEALRNRTIAARSEAEGITSSVPDRGDAGQSGQQWHTATARPPDPRSDGSAGPGGQGQCRVTPGLALTAVFTECVDRCRPTTG